MFENHESFSEDSIFYFYKEVLYLPKNKTTQKNVRLYQYPIELLPPSL
jgi:hypothetical protein